MLLKQKPMDHWRNQRKYKKKYLEINDNGDTIIQNLWDTALAVLRGKFIVQSHVRKQEKYQTNNPNKIQS